MKFDARSRRELAITMLLFCPLLAPGQSLSITNGIQTYAGLTNTSVTMSGYSELHVTGGGNPIPGCIINLNSPDAWLFLPSILPSTVASTLLGQVRVNGAVAVADSNVRVVQYAQGAAVIPQPPSFRPLQAFAGPQFTGQSMEFNQYLLYAGSALGALDRTISSFKLKRGYLATLAQNENGTGISQCYVAQDGDLEVSLIPGGLDNKVRFVRVFPWRWTSKKGVVGDIADGLNVGWYYDWDISQNSTRDLEYVAIRQDQGWPSLNQNWQLRGINTVLGYNEPDHTDQANLTVDQAIASWPDLLATGLRVGAPAVSDGGLSWLYSFMDQANATGLRVDFVPVHYYRCYNPADPNGAASQFYNFLRGIHDRVKRPLWVTEWNNGANWTSCGDPTFAQQQAAVAAMIQMLDNTPFVERYAIYNWVEDVRRVKWDDGSLTAAGVTYRDKVSPVSYVQALPAGGSRSIAQYHFDRDTLDSSGYGNNALALNMPDYTPGPSGDAIALDGSDNYVLLPPNLANSAGFTFAAWVKWNGGGNWQRIFDFGNDTSHYLFLTPSSSSSTLRFAINNGGGEQILEAPRFPVGQWEHVAVTLGGSIARIYTNGVLAASSTGFSIVPSSFNPSLNYLGKSQFSPDPMFAGSLDDVEIADFPFTPAQIASLQTNRAPFFSTNLLDRGTAEPLQAFSSSVAGTAVDPDPGDTLAYSKASGPMWLAVSSNGSLSGTPGSGDGGTNYFTIRATDTAGASAFAVLAVYVPIVYANGTWTSDADGYWSDTNNWSSGLIANGASYLADFSKLNLGADRTVTLDSSRSIGTLSFGDISGVQNWTLASDGSVLTLATGSSATPSIAVRQNTATILAPLAGTNGFAKGGPGTLVLSGTNTLSGTLYVDSNSSTVNDGIIRVANQSALSSIGNIQIRNNNGGFSTLQLDGSTGNLSIPARFNVNCRNNAVPTIENLSGTNVLAGFIALDVGGNMFNIRSDAGLLILSGMSQYQGTLTGGRNYVFSGVGDCWVSGPIMSSPNGAPIGVVKSGTGTLTLTAINYYTNTTTVSGGLLLMNGTSGPGPVLVASSGTLGGVGLIRGPLTVQFGATLSPGTNATTLGTLTINNSVTLQAGSITRMKLSKSPGGNDVLQTSGASGTLNYGGTLVLTNLSGIVTAGDSFKMFNAASYIGMFSSISPATPGVGLLWDTHNLAVNGTLSVVLGNVDPQFGSASLFGTNLVFEGSGGAAGAGFTILTSTNLALPLTDWTSVATGNFDENGEFIFTNNLPPNVSGQFFRVRIP